MNPQSDADIQAVLVAIDPPPGGLTRFRARRRRRPTWPWLLGCALATTVALLLALRITPPPPPARPRRAPVDLIAGRDVSTLHPRWIGLGRVALPAEPMTVTGDLAGALAARRVATEDDAVVFYMLESR